MTKVKVPSDMNGTPHQTRVTKVFVVESTAQTRVSKQTLCFVQTGV